jgi:SAM-dependent methyltransferase
MVARSRYFDRFWTRLVPSSRTARILDAGCGVGSLVWWLQQRGYEMAEGVDVSHELIALGSELGTRNLHCTDVADHLRDRVGMYDCIVFRDVLEHFGRRAMIRLLESARSALAHGGTVIIQVPNAESPGWGRIRYGDFTHEMAFTAASLAQLLAVTRFRPLTFAGAGPMAERKRDLPRYALWKLIEASYKIMLYGVSGRRGAIVTESIIGVATPGTFGVPPEDVR